jgi:hypothetical protein
MLLLPAAAFLPEAIRRLSRRDAGPSRTLLATWVAAGFLVLMAASNKRWYYLLPLQPALALLVALAIAPLWDSDSPKALRWGTRLMGGFMAAGALIVAAVAFHDSAPAPSEDASRLLDLMRAHRGWLAIAGAVFAASGILMVARSFGSNSGMIRAALLAGFLMAGFRSLALDPIRGTEDQYRPFAAELSPRVPPGTVVAVWPPGHGYGLDFYWPAPLARGVAAASSSEYMFVRQIQIPDLPFAVKTMGVVEHASDERRIVLVRRKPSGAPRDEHPDSSHATSAGHKP